jgi:hypothetical protein
MRMNDFFKITLAALFSIVILGCVIMGIIQECSRSRIYSTPKRIIKRERISESSDNEIWRTSTYHLVTVEYDTIPKKTSWDTAHELPR